MDYGMIGKIEKAKRYAEERDRITFNSFAVVFNGYNDTYETTFSQANGFHCSCPGFESHQICPHCMALERLFSPMLKHDPLPYAPGQNVVSDVEKAKTYSEETDRIQFQSFDVVFKGTNNEHRVTYGENGWTSTSDFFKSRGVCSHTMAMERILGNMLPIREAEESVTG